ncbi:unnamed protein product [Parnassius apollo]|uniref:(apollo) hypothetical protein n=1 Tax=Parnassius apollo TaxID=110799 RepID=A0A8S3Y8W9_PARAO|nr:unnamed protein product [Parnassius apollo]
MENRFPSLPWDRELRKDLLSNYNKLLSPDANNTQVSLKFMLNSFYFDDKEEIVTMDSWLFLRWNDSRLTWNPKSYDGITEVLLSSLIIWNPSLKIFTIAYEDEKQAQLLILLQYLMK